MLAFGAEQKIPFFLAGLFYQIGIAALRTGLVYGFVPAYKITFGIVGTAVKNFAALALPLNNFPVAAFFGAAYARAQRLGKFTRGIIGAG